MSENSSFAKDLAYLFVRAQWEKQRARSKILTEAEIRERIPQGHPLQCPICNKLFQDAVKTPCCNTTFCQECLHSHLSDNDFFCPNCHQKIITLASVKPDIEARRKADDYTDAAFEEHRQQEVRSANVVVKVRLLPMKPSNRVLIDLSRMILSLRMQLSQILLMGLLPIQMSFNKKSLKCKRN